MENLKAKEKICSFYASDYHFEMISLPYIEKNLEENKKVFVLTENNLEDTINNLINKVNLNKNKKEKILKINWKNNNKNKMELLKNDEEEEDKIIFVKGSKNYIKNINNDLEKIENKNSNMKIIDCYNIEETGENIEDIINNYKKMLRTTGEKEIKKN